MQLKANHNKAYAVVKFLNRRKSVFSFPNISYLRQTNIPLSGIF